MKKFFIVIAILIGAIAARAEVVNNPAAVVAMLQRVANISSDKLVTILDTDLGADEQFIITSIDGMPAVKGNTLSALTTGVNWYLNHYAHVNIAWNQLTTDLSGVSLPVPATEERHPANVDYRYYLNYCTFSYSMSTWTWDRWQKEIDWMALHGINMPLQIVGLEVVWRDFLVNYYGYSKDEANAFVAGPCFQAWFGMNNLEGWGGPNPDWWYDRQQALATKILERERELGIEPVLPGFSGMIPHDFGTKTGIAAESQGGWCGFQRPYILDPTSADFTTVAANYYKALAGVMGQSLYYSMDPFHEGGRISSGKYAEGYTAIFDAMNQNCGANSKWVIQQWQWGSHQATSLNAVPAGRLLVLDLFSDGQPAFNTYNGYAPQEALYCTIPNFGGRSGFMGRLDKQMKEYFAYKAKYSTINGIGATPEAIEQVPVLYDNLYELPWMTSVPESAEAWLRDYTMARYGGANNEAQEAWELLRTSALNCQTSLQGPHEAVYCARPSLTVNAVSSWGGTEIFYNPQDVISAAHKLLAADLKHPNYDYDLVEISRQVLSDYSKALLAGIKEASDSQNTTAFNLRKTTFLNLILDIDQLLGTNENFRLGHWTQMARDMANEAEGTTEADRDWLELDNARTILTTWGDYAGSENGGLRDYSYRAWQGLLKDYYYPRWEYWFNHNMSKPTGGWFYHDWEWAHNLEIDYTKAAKTTTKEVREYSATPVGDTRTAALEIMPKYVVPIALADGNKYYLYRALNTDATADLQIAAYRGEDFLMPLEVASTEGYSLKVDFNNDGDFTDQGETANGLQISVPATAAKAVKALLTHTDGTTLTFTLQLSDNVTEPRQISVYSTDTKAGSVAISDTTDLSVNTTDEVELTATPTSKYRFLNWTTPDGTVFSQDNPLVYSLAPAISLWANFEWSPWTVPTENLKDLSTIQSYMQFVNSFTAAVGNGTATEIYNTATCPSLLFQLTEPIEVQPGEQITIQWYGNDGLRYCYLTAYLDNDANGTFEKKLGTIGTASAQNANVVSGQIKFTAPQKECTTRARFRFDSAWLLPSGPNAEATRFTYDIPIIVSTLTSVNRTQATPTLDIQAGKGYAQVLNASPKTQTVSFVNENGIVVKHLSLKPNTTARTSLHPGVYIINHRKIKID